MATETVVALDSHFKLLLMSRILIAVEKMVASCYNRDQTWLCVYCWCQTPSGVVSPRGDLALTCCGSCDSILSSLHKNMKENICKWQPLWYISFVNYASTIFQSNWHFKQCKKQIPEQMRNTVKTPWEIHTGVNFTMSLLRLWGLWNAINFGTFFEFPVLCKPI